MVRDRLGALLDRFQGRRVLVVGDCMLDEYLWGHVNRIPPEAPVQVVEQVETTYAAGGASNVAVNIVAMDGIASIVSVVGQDEMGARLRMELERQGVRHEGIVADPARPTTVKTRILAHSQQVLRVDRESRAPITGAVEGKLIDQALKQLRESDAVLFSDYSKGALTETVVAEVSAAARAAKVPFFVNPKPSTLRYYQGANLVSLNQSETEAVTGLSLGSMDALEGVGERLMGLCAAEAAIVTLGGRGLVVLQSGKPCRHLPVVPLEVYDSCGCGDSTIAAAALARTAGADWVEAATVANLAGNAKVRKLGVVPVTRKEIHSVWEISSNGGPKRQNGLE